MALLLDLPVELHEAIFYYILVPDLKNLSLTNKALHELAKRYLWKNVRIYWESLLKIKIRLDNLKYTKSIQFLDSDKTLDHPDFVCYDPGADDFRSLLRKRWCWGKVKKITKNYKRILSYCDVNNLVEFQTSRGGALLLYACQVLKKTKILNITDVFNIWSTGDKVLPDPLSQIKDLEQLVELHAHGNSHTSLEIFMLSSGLKKLKVLDLGSNCFDDDLTCVAYISKLTNLQELSLCDCHLSNPSLHHITSLHSLQRLDISYNTSITDVGVEKLVQLKSLLHLSLSGCRRIKDKSAEFITSLPLLRSLQMCATRISDVGMLHLCKLGALHQLTVRMCPFLTVLSLTYVRDMKSLRIIDIRDNEQLEEAELRTLADHQSLRQINFSRPSINKVGEIDVLDPGVLHYHDPGVLHYHDDMI